jgi:amino acid transporter
MTRGDDPTTRSIGDASLKKDAISASGIVFLVLAAASPLIGLTGAVPSAMVVGNGLGVTLAYVVVGLILLLFAVGYVAMAHQVTNAGALYAYIGRGLGTTVGVGAASIAVWAYTVVQIAIYAFFGVVAGGALNAWFGLEIPWWALTLILVGLVQVFGYLQIDIGAKVLGVLLVLEWGTMAVLGLAIAVQGGAGEGFAATTVLSPGTLLSGAPGVALVFAFASMFGFEAAAIYGEEVRDPKRSVPRATYLSIVLILLFFAFTSWMLVVGYGPEQAVGEASRTLESGDPAQYVFTAGERYLGQWAPYAMSSFVITSMFAAALAFHNSIARYFFTLGRNRVLPTALAHVHPRTKAPIAASITQSVSAVLLMAPFMLVGADPVTTLFFWGSGIAVVGIVTLYVLVAVAVVVFFHNNPVRDPRRWHTQIAPALAALILTCALVLIALNFPTLIGGSAGSATVLALTIPLFFLVGLALARAMRSRLSPAALADLEHELR